ncbi:MAG: Nif3-like dinuclear metal center hexameric protein [Pseudomonadales bacterium]|nr:Nif3-like dinuclear metal center hexameric protein [Pseudomonadales bacterium]
MENIQTVLEALNTLLEPWKFKDYCPNGLQVEGRPEIRKIVTGVTACQALIERAVEEDADMILVHHGYFWKGEDSRVVGTKKRRLALLLNKEINLVAYHLPLDAHMELGNNACLAKLLGIKVKQALVQGEDPAVGFIGELEEPCFADELTEKIAVVLQRKPMFISGHDRHEKIHSIGWCSGAAQGYIDHAITQGVDAYLSGEISEHTVHTARENGIHYFAAGHHATERYGVQALGEYLADKFSLEHQFIDIDNPV